MAYQSGHGGSVTGVGLCASIETWDLDDGVQIHQTSVLTDEYDKVTPGRERWTAIVTFLVDDAEDFSAATTKPGSAITALTMKAGGATNGDYIGSAGVIRNVRVTRDGSREIRGTMTIDGNGSLTRPKNTT